MLLWMRSILGNLDIMQIKPVPDLTEQEMNTEFIVRKFRLFRYAFISGNEGIGRRLNLAG